MSLVNHSGEVEALKQVLIEKGKVREATEIRLYQEESGRICLSYSDELFVFVATLIDFDIAISDAIAQKIEQFENGAPLHMEPIIF